MRTDQEALLHAYLSEYEKLQANTVSGGKKKVAAGAAAGAAAMNQMGRVSIPDSYDAVPSLAKMAVQQNKSELAEAERQRKAAERAALKAAKESQESAEKDAAAQMAAERLAKLEQARRGNVKAAPAAKQGIMARNDPGQKSAATVSRQEKNKETSSWWDNLWNGGEGAQGYTHRGSGRAPIQVTRQAAENSGAAAEAGYARMSFADKEQEYLALLEQWQALEGQKQKLPGPNAPAETLYTQEEYDISQRNAELAQRQKDLEKEFKVLQKALERDPEYQQLQRQEAQTRTLEDYLDPAYKLNSADQERAQQIIESYYAQNPLAEKARRSQANRGNRGASVGLRQAFEQMSEEQKREYERIQALQTKLNKPASFALNLADAFPFVDMALDKVGELAGQGEETSFSSAVRGAQQQNPLSSTAGRLAGTLLEYQAGSALMKRVPGVGKALDKAGQAVAGTRAAQALGQLPVLGHLGTAGAVSGILGDQILDTAFDTIPSLYDDIQTYRTQGEDGDLSVGDILGNTAKNVGFNFGMNLLGEAIQGGLQNRAQRVPALESQNEAVATGPETVLGQQLELPTLKEQTAAKAALGGAGGDPEIQALREAFENGTLTRAQMETLKPNGMNRAAFEEATGLRLPPTSGETRRMLTAGPDGSQAIKSGDGKSLAQLDLQTASWDDILNSPEIRQAREQAKFDTPTIEINTPERQALRQQIADELMDMGSFSGKDAAGNELFTGPVRRERRADIVIGPPAAGKSSVLANPLSQEYGSRIIDSDMAKAKLPEFNGGVGASRVHLESAQISEDMMIGQAIIDGDNIVIPWVGKTPDKLRAALEKLKRAGYTVHLSLNELDPDIAARRAVERFQNTGRLVDPEYILGVGWKPSEVYDILKSEGGFDSYVKYSNDVPYGQPAKLIEGPGVVEEVQTGRVGGPGGGSGFGSNGSSFGGNRASEATGASKEIGDSDVRYSNDVGYGEPAKLLERVRLDEVQAGRMGGYGGGYSAESNGMAYPPKETSKGQVGDNYGGYSNDALFRRPAQPIERIGEEPLQDGRMGGHGGGLRSGRDARSVGAAQTAEIGTAGVSSQGNQAAFSVPEIPPGMKERGYAESLRTGSDLPEEVKQAFIDRPEVYRQLSNAETAAKADAIMSQGLDRARAQYYGLLSKKDPAAVPLGKDLADELIAQGRREEAVQVLRELSENLTGSGQFSQAAAITLMKNDPMTALQYIQRDIDRLNLDGAEKFGRKWKDFVLTGDEIAAFGAAPAGDEAALKELFERIGARIAKEYPVTAWEKLVETSHIAMLLNPRTQTRNVLANVAILPEQWFSRKLSAAGQKITSWFKDGYEPNQALRVSRGSRELAGQAYDSVKAGLGGTAGKWENTALKGRADKEVFKLKADQNLVSRLPVLGDTFNALGDGLGKVSQKVAGENVFEALSSEKSVAENLRQFTYGLLELGDEPFVRKNFVDRLASFIEARGYKTLDEVPPEAYEVAMQEALKATFKDDNAISNLLVKGKRLLDPVGELFTPFTRTPANITARALDYSPVGLLRGIIKWVKNGGDPSGYIDEIAKGLTGTGLILLGAQLYKAGVITGPASENARQAAFDRQQGKLPYAIKVGDNYYTFDWAQPASMGLILGTTLAAQSERDGGLDAQSVWDAMKSATVTFGDTLFEQSTLQSLANIFEGYGSFTENLIGEAIEAPQRLLPSLSGALARTADPVQRQTFSNGDVPKTQLDTLQSKIPFLSQNLPAAYDTWGNEIHRADSVGESAFAQLLSPGQLGNTATTPLDGEISRLFEATGDEKVFPRKADWSVTFNGVTHKLNNMDYAEYQRVMGQLSFQLADELMGSSAYRGMDDEGKVRALGSAYDLARKAALDELYQDYSSDDKLLGLYQEGGVDQVIPYLLSDAEIRAARAEKQERTGSTSAALTGNETYAAVYGVPGLTSEQHAAAYLARATSDKKAQLAYDGYGADGLEAYLGLRSVADLDGNGSISKKELTAVLDASALAEEQKAYYFDLLKPGEATKNPYQ